MIINTAAIIISFYSVSAEDEIVSVYRAAISAHEGEIITLAREYTTPEYEITGVITLEFDIAEDGSAQVTILGTNITDPAFKSAVIDRASGWSFDPHDREKVVVFKQFVIPHGTYTKESHIEIGQPICATSDCSDGADKITKSLAATLSYMDYRYGAYLRDYPGCGGFSLLLIYTDYAGYLSRVSTKFTDLKDYTFRTEIEGWLKANFFPGDLPSDSVIALPIRYYPMPEGSPTQGDYQLCLMGYKDLLQARYDAYVEDGDGGEGGVKLSIEVDSAGNVSDVTIVDYTLSDEGFIGQIPGIVKEWKFPSGGGMKVDLTYVLR